MFQNNRTSSWSSNLGGPTRSMNDEPLTDNPMANNNLQDDQINHLDDCTTEMNTENPKRTERTESKTSTLDDQSAELTFIVYNHR